MNGSLRAYESRKIWIGGLIIDELCENPSYWNKSKTLHEWLIENRVPGICDIDTRELTKHIRSTGSLLGRIVKSHIPKSLFTEADFDDPNRYNLVKEVSIKVRRFANSCNISKTLNKSQVHLFTRYIDSRTK